MSKQKPRFTSESLKFLLKVSKQKNPEWLERNRAEYERLLLEPLKHLAAELKSELGSVAPGYNFPQKGIGRLKRSAIQAKEYGALYRDWMHYSAARPRSSRFEHNPNLYFLLNPSDQKDPVLIAGGLYMPSSRQMRALRESIANDASEFEKLFKSKDFSKHFKGGFSLEKSSSRVPRGFDPSHPRMDWIRLQAFFVWKPYTIKQFTSPGFPKLVIEDCRQILRLNALLESATTARPARSVEIASKPGLTRSKGLGSRIESVEAPRRKMDF